jgi:hypothetical protein
VTFFIALNSAKESTKSSEEDRKNFFINSRANIFEYLTIVNLLKDYKTIPEKDYLENVTLADEL